MLLAPAASLPRDPIVRAAALPPARSPTMHPKNPDDSRGPLQKREPQPIEPRPEKPEPRSADDKQRTEHDEGGPDGRRGRTPDGGRDDAPPSHGSEGGGGLGQH
jgi:hypothetical protein